MNPDVAYRCALWMRGCRTVEDWGGTMRPYIHAEAYRPVPPGADLADYIGSAQGIVVRAVLEYRLEDWRMVLHNAIASFTKHLAVAIGTPTAPTTGPMLQGPLMCFSMHDIQQPFIAANLTHRVEYLANAERSKYGGEWVIYAERE